MESYKMELGHLESMAREQETNEKKIRESAIGLIKKMYDEHNADVCFNWIGDSFDKLLIDFNGKDGMKIDDDYLLGISKVKGEWDEDLYILKSRAEYNNGLMRSKYLTLDKASTKNLCTIARYMDRLCSAKSEDGKKYGTYSDILEAADDSFQKAEINARNQARDVIISILDQMEGNRIAIHKHWGFGIPMYWETMKEAPYCIRLYDAYLERTSYGTVFINVTAEREGEKDAKSYSTYFFDTKKMITLAKIVVDEYLIYMRDKQAADVRCE